MDEFKLYKDRDIIWKIIPIKHYISFKNSIILRYLKFVIICSKQFGRLFKLLPMSKLHRLKVNFLHFEKCNCKILADYKYLYKIYDINPYFLSIN